MRHSTPTKRWRQAGTAIAAFAALVLGAERADAAGGAYAVDDVEVGAVGSCKVESWLSYASNTDLVASTVPACVFNLGRPVEISTQLQRFRSGGEWGSGLTLKAKTNIIPVEPGKIGLGIFGGTGFDLVTGENTGAFLGVPVTFQLHEQFRINVNAGWLWDRIADQHFAVWGAGFEWNFVKPLTLIGEVFGQAGPGSNDPRAQLGLRYTPMEAFDIDVIYGNNITGERAHWITVGLNVRFNPNGK
jgi:hypothetical protein